jgi:hypothetical protein
VVACHGAISEAFPAFGREVWQAMVTLLKLGNAPFKICHAARQWTGHQPVSERKPSRGPTFPVATSSAICRSLSARVAALMKHHSITDRLPSLQQFNALIDGSSCHVATPKTICSRSLSANSRSLRAESGAVRVSPRYLSRSRFPRPTHRPMMTRMSVKGKR